MKSTAIGSAVSVLLVFSAISHANGYIQRQDPKPVQQPNPAQQVQTSSERPRTVPADQAEPSKQESGSAESASSPSLTRPSRVETAGTSVSESDFEVAPQTYTATAYSLRGRTASGKLVARGLIAADPSILPLGTRVRVEAGSFSGEYEVADTGGGVKGRRIDIWTPTSREALQFGRRAVKLTVLSFGGRRRAKSAAVRPRRVTTVTSPATEALDRH